MSQNVKEVKERLQKNTFRVMLRVLAVFALSAVLAAIIGDLIDQHLGIAPWGTLFLLGLFYFVSWFFVLKTLKDVRSSNQQISEPENKDNEVDS